VAKGITPANRKTAIVFDEAERTIREVMFRALEKDAPAFMTSAGAARLHAGLAW
jgi:hypothetical protein